MESISEKNIASQHDVVGLDDRAKQAINWHAVYAPIHGGIGRTTAGTDATSNSVLTTDCTGLPECKSGKDTSSPLLPVLKLHSSHSQKFVLESAEEIKEDASTNHPIAEIDAKYGLKGTFEHESARSYLHASINRKQGGIDEVFADEHITAPLAAKAKAEPDVWTVGAITAGHERKVFDSENATVWFGLGATVNPVFDRELREKTSAAPVTVFTNFRINY